MAGRQYTNPSTPPQARHPGSGHAVTADLVSSYSRKFAFADTNIHMSQKGLEMRPKRADITRLELIHGCPILNRRWEYRNGKFQRDVGGMHEMPEQKRFRGRHPVHTPRGDQCLRLGTSVAAFILGACLLRCPRKLLLVHGLNTKRDET